MAKSSGNLDDQSLVNRQLGDFRILSKLGAGGMAAVYLADQLSLKRKVAIKILEKDRIKDKGDVERVTREINILKKVRHPNVIQLYEVRPTTAL